MPQERWDKVCVSSQVGRAVHRGASRPQATTMTRGSLCVYSQGPLHLHR